MQEPFTVTKPVVDHRARRAAKFLFPFLILLFSASAANLSLASPAMAPLPALITVTPDDPYFPQQWNLNDSRPAQLHFPEAWGINKGKGSDDVVIAVIDSGIDLNHEDLRDRLWVNTDEIPNNNADDDNNGYKDDVNGYDFANGDAIPEDNDGHGTMVTGVIAAETDNSLGIAGVTWHSRIMVLKTGEHVHEWSAIKSAIDYAVSNGAKIINLSSGIATDYCGQGNTSGMRDAILNAYNNGVIIVASSGNQNVNKVECPAILNEVIAVGATNDLDERCAGQISALNCLWVESGSSYGNELDLVAPGGTSLVGSLLGYKLLTTELNNSTPTIFGGTSAAAPQVSGLIALMLSVNPNLTPAQIQDILERTAYKIPAYYGPFPQPGTWSPEVGFGRIDAYAAVSAVNIPPSVPSIRILLKSVLERNEPPAKDYSSQVVLVIQRQDPFGTVLWGPVIFSTDSSGYSPALVFNGLGPGTYDVCAKPKYHEGVCKSATLAVGSNPTIDFSDGGTQGAWPGDIDANGEENTVNGLDASTWTNYALQFGLGQSGPYDFNRDGITNGNDMSKLVNTRAVHAQGEGHFGRPFPHGISGNAATGLTSNTDSALDAQAASAVPSFYFQIPGSTHAVGETFDIGIIINTDGLATDAADAILHYDPGVLEVVDMDAVTPGIQVTMGTAYPSPTVNSVDPVQGIVSVGAKDTSGAFNGTGTLATVRFRGVASTGLSSATALTLRFTLGDTTQSILAEHVTALSSLASVATAQIYIYGSPARPLPTVSVSPVPNTYINLLYQPISATVSDPYGQVERVDFQAYYDASWHSLASDTNAIDGWTITWDNLGIADQVIQLRAVAWLPGELNSTVTAGNISLDRTPPAYGTSNFVPSSPSDAANIQVNVNASDNLAGVQRIELYVNSASDGSTSGDWLLQGSAETGNSATINWDTSGFAPGTYQVAFAIKDYGGNWNRWDAAGLPVITYTLTSPMPDLHPYAPAGFPYPVVPSSIQGTHEVNTLYVGQPTYFDWRFINSGRAIASGNFYVELWVDNTRYVRYPFSNVGSGWVFGIDDWAEVVSTPGWHTVRLITDPDNTIAESNETNNVWEQQFYWVTSAPPVLSSSCPKSVVSGQRLSE